MKKRKIVVSTQLLMMLILTFLGVKNSFDVFIYATIILSLLSIGLNVICMKSNS